MTRRAVGFIRRLIAALIAFVLAWELPRIWSHEPFDHTHLEDVIQIQDNRPQVEQAPPPVDSPPRVLSSRRPSYDTPDAADASMITGTGTLIVQRRKIAATAA